MFNQEVHEILTNSVLTKLLGVTRLYDDDVITAEEALEHMDRLGVVSLQEWETQEIDGSILIADISNNCIKTAQGITVHDIEETVERWFKLLYQD